MDKKEDDDGDDGGDDVYSKHKVSQYQTAHLVGQKWWTKKRKMKHWCLHLNKASIAWSADAARLPISIVGSQQCRCAVANLIRVFATVQCFGQYLV